MYHIQKKQKIKNFKNKIYKKLYNNIIKLK